MNSTTLRARAAMTLLLAMLLPLWGLWGQVWAEDVTAEQALQQAQSFVKKHQPTTGQRRAPGTTPQLTLAHRVSGLYVFNVGSDDGFVIVSNDDRATPILGFSDSGHIDADNMPDNMLAWLQGYADQIAWLQKQPTLSGQSAQSRAPRRTVKADIPAMVTTLWNQGAPYNNQCPYYSGTNRAVTGCVATAMAQVMNYHEWPQDPTTSIPGYTTGSYKIELAALPATTFDWANMADNYKDPTTSAQQTAVATLMRYCGQSVKMNYGPSSGASTRDVATALKSYFGYKSTTQFVSRSFYTYANWIELIYHELSEGRPVVYGGQSSGGGHEFVCDGYKYKESTDFFHINWGWGGMSNNYFVLSALDPDEQGTGGSYSEDGYNFGQDAVVGIQKPNDEGTVLDLASTVSLTINSITLSKTTVAHGETVTITINVTNNSTDDYDGELSLVVNSQLGDGKMFVIRAGLTQNCTFTYTPAGAGTYVFKCALPNTSGGYSWGSNPSATLKVDDKTPSDLTATDITYDEATIGWTSGDTKWNIQYRPLTITETNFSEGMPTGWTDHTQGEPSSYWLTTPTITLGGSITFWAGGEGTSGSFRVYVQEGGSGSYYSVSDLITVTSTRKEYTVSLDDYSGTGKLAFIINNASDNTADIDDITIVEPGSWTTINNVTTKPYTLTGLTPETHYEVQVQAVVGEATTEWSDPLYFTTENVNPTDLTVLPTSGTAKASWTSHADSYDVRYGVLPSNVIVNEPPSWLQYDNGTYETSYGSSAEQTYTWGVMYPGSMITCNLLTKVAIFETSSNTADITVKIYSGGSNAPGTLLHSETIATVHNHDFHEVTLASPVTITPGENLWITLTETGTYPLTTCESNEPNNRWMKNGDNWNYFSKANRGWMIRGYMETKELGDDDIAWTTVSCSNTTYTMTGLAAETDYVMQVRGLYGSEGKTPWVTETFTTTANAIELADAGMTNSDLIDLWNGLQTTVTLAGRTLYKDGEWNTICLPFNVTLEGSPLEGAVAKTLTDATMTGTHVTLTFGDDVTELQAGVPYIIKWANDTEHPTLTESDLVFTNVNVVNSTAAARTIEKADGHVKFIGYYDAFNITTDDDDIYYMTAGNTLKHTGKARTLKACRAYFQFSAAATSRQFVMDFGNGDATRLNDNGKMINDKEADAWYTLDGRKVNGQLKKGVYIQNGRKVVIK